MSHADLPGCHKHDMDTHVKLFTWRLQEVVGVLLMVSSRCVDTPRHRQNGHLWEVEDPCMLAGLGHQGRNVGSLGLVEGGWESGGCLVLGLDLDILSGAAGCRAWVLSPRALPEGASW